MSVNPPQGNSPGSVPANSPPSTPGWRYDTTSIRLYDGTQNNYGAASGPGVIIELGSQPAPNLFPQQLAYAFFRGHVLASHIEGIQGGPEGKGARMWMDLTAGDPFIMPAGPTPGLSPYWAITDQYGTVRVEGGFLAALGPSPQQWGLRVNDQNDNPIFDSFGLLPSAVLPFAPGGGLSVSASTSGTTLVTVNAVTFVLSRTTNLLTWSQGTVTRTDANTGLFQCNIGLQLDGNYNSSSPYGDLSGDFLPVTMGAALNNGTLGAPYHQMILWRNVAPGQHTVALTIKSSGASGVFTVGGTPEVATLGGAIGG